MWVVAVYVILRDANRTHLPHRKVVFRFTVLGMVASPRHNQFIHNTYVRFTSFDTPPLSYRSQTPHVSCTAPFRPAKH